MISEELSYRIVQCLGHVPTAEQAEAIRIFARFMGDRQSQAAMVMRGCAGTGKTSLAAAIVKAMLALKQKIVLMAPTGRAAKVFSIYAGQPAYTIHRRIYRQRTAGDLSAFSLNDNLHTDTLFIVDEASMISLHGSSTMGGESSSFGTGSLLDDLIQYVYGGRNCRLLLIGDTAQLPPVGEEEAPALMTGELSAYGLNVYETDLNEVLRQAEGSGILWNATRIRNLTPSLSSMGEVSSYYETLLLPKIHLDGFTDVCAMPGDELIESLATSYSRVGVDDTMVVTRSNKRANIYNQGIRNTVLDREDELCAGDRIMIVKNNYYWLAKSSDSEGDRHQSDSASSVPSTSSVGHLEFIANGDIAIVRRVRHVHELYGFRFAEVTMTLPDYHDFELTAIVLLDTLTSEAPALTREQQEQLFNKVMEDYMDVPYKSDRLKKIKEDKYYNALQIKFAYAVTCHKAQGGQWAHVYIDQGYMTDDMLTPDYLHWLYTAFTRATEKVFLVNWPARQLESGATDR